MRQRTVLFVDDCEQEREILGRYLEFVGGKVLTAGDGEEGLRLAEEHLPDLILLDLSLPVLDGWETLERLQQEPATASIPVVALTAHHLSRERLEAAGFRGYLEKPIVPYHMLQEVERTIGRLDMTEFDTATRPVSERPPISTRNAMRPSTPAPRKRTLRSPATLGAR